MANLSATRTRVHVVMPQGTAVAFDADQVSAEPGLTLVKMCRCGGVIVGTPPQGSPGRPCLGTITKRGGSGGRRLSFRATERSEEHTSELQSQFHLVCRL